MSERISVVSIEEIEKFAGRKFVHAKAISALIEQAAERHMEPAFNDILFFAKFLANAYAVLSRSGMGSTDTEKLSIEFKENFEKVSTLIKTLMKEAAPDAKAEFIKTFFDSTQQGVERLMALLRELTWVKNYRLDKGHEAENKQ